MKIENVHCFFEQSGTFKNQFKQLGVNAIDYDIRNDFGQTDVQADLFGEIANAYDGKSSLFDRIGKDDLILAFFPCVRFDALIPLSFRGERPVQTHWSDERKLAYSMQLHEELHLFYMTISKLFAVCLRGGYRLIVENPYTQPHYLTTYFPIRPKIIDKDRTINGDYYAKPTQYWFVNCDPEQNVLFEPIEHIKTQTVKKAQKTEGDTTRTVKRSLIHPQYASRFIRQFVLDA